MFEGKKVTFVTFAGRRDRMSLLVRYVDEAIARGLVDEWHVWDFTRSSDDQQWLHSTVPALRRTADDFTYRLAQTFGVASTGATSIGLSVAATNDAHIGIRSKSQDGTSCEIFFGGWGNQRSGVRVMQADRLMDHGTRTESDEKLVCERHTPGILSRWEHRRIDLAITAQSVKVLIDDVVFLEVDVELGAGEYELLVKSGWGTDAEWRFDADSDAKKLLFIGGNKTNPNYNDFYDYYSRSPKMDPGDVVIKCDDDIVFIDLSRLENFIEFRIDYPQYFLVSANVVNNGVCAYYQQEAGAIPLSLMTLELPPQGVCGSLWESSDLACKLHQLFTDDNATFRQRCLTQKNILWDERLSINFVSWLGHSFSYMAAHFEDDEKELSQLIPPYLGRTNCIYAPMTVAHLSFYVQDQGLPIEAVLTAYEGLLTDMLVEERTTDNEVGIG